VERHSYFNVAWLLRTAVRLASSMGAVLAGGFGCVQETLEVALHGAPIRCLAVQEASPAGSSRRPGRRLPPSAAAGPGGRRLGTARAAPPAGVRGGPALPDRPDRQASSGAQVSSGTSHSGGGTTAVAERSNGAQEQQRYAHVGIFCSSRGKK